MRETFACSSPTYGTAHLHGSAISLIDRYRYRLRYRLAHQFSNLSNLTAILFIDCSKDIVFKLISVLGSEKRVEICDYSSIRMDSLTTHPSTALQAKAFTSPASLSYPGGAGDLTPPSEKDGSSQALGTSGHGIGANGNTNGQQKQGGNAANEGNGVTPTTPAATPGATQNGVSGIVPTLQ